MGRAAGWREGACKDQPSRARGGAACSEQCLKGGSQRHTMCGSRCSPEPLPGPGLTGLKMLSPRQAMKAHRALGHPGPLRLYYTLKLFEGISWDLIKRVCFECKNCAACKGPSGKMVVFPCPVAEPDELIAVFGHIKYHPQEVQRALSNSLAKGQTLGTHMEPEEENKQNQKKAKGKNNTFEKCT